jgi:hypothetical protein
MDERALRQLWSILGAVTAYYSLSAWLHSQGGGALFSAAFVDDRKVPNAYFSIIIVGVLVTLLCLIGARYAQLKRSNGVGAGLARLPVSVIEAVDTKKLDGRLFQTFFVITFILIPLGSTIHFWDKLTTNGHVFSHPQDDLQAKSRDWPLSSQWYSHAVLFGEQGVLRYCIAHQDSADSPPNGNPCVAVNGTERGGVDWLPIWSPLLLLLSTFGAWATALFFAFQIFVAKKAVADPF